MYFSTGILQLNSKLSHISIAFFLWNIGKQYKTRSDASKRGVWSGSPLFAYRSFFLNLKIYWKIPPNNPKNGNGLVQLIRMGTYIRHKWVCSPESDCSSVLVYVISFWPPKETLQDMPKWHVILKRIRSAFGHSFLIGIHAIHMGLDARKPVFGGLRTTQAQTSLRIRAVWSAPLLFAFCKVQYLSLLHVQAKFHLSS